MRSVNKIILVGHVGRDPEVRTARTGTRVATFSLATSRRVKDEEMTEWHRVKCFGKQAEFVEQYVGKGDALYVEGRIEYGTSEHDGVTKYWTDVVAFDVNAIGRSAPTPASTAAGWGDGDDPF